MSPQQPKVLERHLQCEQTMPNGWRRTLPVILRYDASDPFAVTMIFPAVHERMHDVTWLFEYDMLHHACAEPQGEGQIRFTPWEDGVWLRVDLQPASGSTTIWLLLRHVQEFLEASFRLVPTSEDLDRARQAALDSLPRALE